MVELNEEEKRLALLQLKMKEDLKKLVWGYLKDALCSADFLQGVSPTLWQNKLFQSAEYDYSFKNAVRKCIEAQMQKP